jgi:hypothetical protein
MMAQGNTSDRSLTVNYSLDKVSTIAEVLSTFTIDDTIDFVRRALQYLAVDAHCQPVPLDAADHKVPLNLPWAGDVSLPYSTKQTALSKQNDPSRKRPGKAATQDDIIAS